MDYFKKIATSGANTQTYYYAKDGNTLYIFGPSPTDASKWNYTYQTGTLDYINMILNGATGATRAELDAPINQIQTTLSGI